MTDLVPLLANPTAIVGTTGAGKTFTAKGAIEKLLELARRVVIVDPTGAWWGLRSGADGDPDGGYPVTIFGGDHADIPIAADHGATIAEAIATREVQAIVDVSEMTANEKTRFLTDFLQTLYARNKAALHLVVDEADEVCPQNPMPDERRLSGAFDKIVRRGRIKGFRPLMITQRPAVLHKNVLSQIGTLIALKLTSPQDRKAIEDWVKGNADAGEARAVMQSLPTLDRGEGWVWSPADGVLERRRFPAIATFDSSRTPAEGEAPVEPALTAVDVAALREVMTHDDASGFPKSATHDKSAPAAADLEAAEQRGYRHGFDEGYREGRNDGSRSAAHTQLVRIVDSLVGAAMLNGDADALNDALSRMRAIKIETRSPDRAKIAHQGPEKTSTKPAPSGGNGLDRGQAGQKSSSDDPLRQAVRQREKNRHLRAAIEQLATGLTGPQLTILQALAWWRHKGHETPSRPQIAAIAGWKANSSHLKNRLSELSTMGLVEYPEPKRVRLTVAGIEAAPSPDTSRSMVDGIRAVLTGPQLAIFNALLPHGTSPCTRSEIANACGWDPGSSHLKNRLSELSTMQIVHYPAPRVVALEGWIFEGGPQ